MTLREYVVFMILNQDELEHEVHPLPFPEWNRGYREAMQDVLKEMGDE